jgi:hypothetical protein
MPSPRYIPQSERIAAVTQDGNALQYVRDKEMFFRVAKKLNITVEKE